MTNADFRFGPIISNWKPAGTDIGYLFAGQVDRMSDAGAPPWTVLTVGAQINAVNRSGIHQIAFGIATEAWAEQGSHSMLTGIEASVINREPSNPWRKIAMWSTFKNRPDTEYFQSSSDPMNLDSQALRVQSQPGTGFERGFVFAEESLAASRNERYPIVVDFSEVPLEKLAGWVLVRYPDGWCETYAGGGRKLIARCPR
jgi:hypothetical protein